MTQDNNEMRAAYQNIFGKEWESEPIMLREWDLAQQEAFQAAYQLQQTKLEKAVKALEHCNYCLHKIQIFDGVDSLIINSAKIETATALAELRGK